MHLGSRGPSLGNKFGSPTFRVTYLFNFRYMTLLSSYFKSIHIIMKTSFKRSPRWLDLPQYSKSINITAPTLRFPAKTPLLEKTGAATAWHTDSGTFGSGPIRFLRSAVGQYDRHQVAHTVCLQADQIATETVQSSQDTQQNLYCYCYCR